MIKNQKKQAKIWKQNHLLVSDLIKQARLDLIEKIETKLIGKYEKFTYDNEGDLYMGAKLGRNKLRQQQHKKLEAIKKGVMK